jgi:hypothetical protein
VWSYEGMAKKTEATQETAPHPTARPRIFKASLRADGSVVKADEINETEAVGARQSQSDVVVCGSDPDLNSALAKQIENAASGSYVRHGKHRPNGLNHYQPLARPPAGHTFYETKNSRARRR